MRDHTSIAEHDAGYACAGITTQGRACKRRATVHFAQENGTCNGHYCRQHSKGDGVMRALLPYPWEFHHVEVYS